MDGRPFLGIFSAEAWDKLVDDAWGRHYAHFTGDEVALPRFDDAAFLDAVSSPLVRYPQVVAFDQSREDYLVDHLEYGRSDAPSADSLRIDRRRVHGLARSGATIKLYGAAEVVPDLRRVYDEARRQFDCPLHVNAYYKATPGPGARRHYDKEHTLALQCWGSKRWRLGDRVLVESACDAYAPKIEPADMPVPNEIVTRAGDVLYIPPGVAHEVHTDVASLHVTLGVHTKRVFHLLLDRITAAAKVDPALREDAPRSRAEREALGALLVANALDALVARTEAAP